MYLLSRFFILFSSLIEPSKAFFLIPNFINWSILFSLSCFHGFTSGGWMLIIFFTLSSIFVLSLSFFAISFFFPIGINNNNSFKYFSNHLHNIFCKSCLIASKSGLSLKEESLSDDIHDIPSYSVGLLSIGE